RSVDGRRHRTGGRLLGAQLAPDGIGTAGKIRLGLEVPPRQKIPRGAAAHRGVAVGGKVQPQQVQHGGAARLKPVPVPRQQAAALLVLHHQRLGGVLPRQVLFGKARLGQDAHFRRKVQRRQRAGGVGGRAAAPVL